MTLDSNIGALILASSTFLVALAYTIKKCRDVQIGTCCKMSLGTPRNNQGQESPDIEMPQQNLSAQLANAVIPVLVESATRQET